MQVKDQSVRNRTSVTSWEYHNEVNHVCHSENTIQYCYSKHTHFYYTADIAVNSQLVARLKVAHIWKVVDVVLLLIGAAFLQDF